MVSMEGSSGGTSQVLQPDCTRAGWVFMYLVLLPGSVRSVSSLKILSAVSVNCLPCTPCFEEGHIEVGDRQAPS